MNSTVAKTSGYLTEDTRTGLYLSPPFGNSAVETAEYSSTIKIKGYAYAVPYVIDKKRKVVFLKTVYPSRVLTEKYLEGGVKK
jgi:hypothetical protein